MRAVDSIIDGASEEGDHFLVLTIGIDTLLITQGAKDSRQTSVGVELVEFVNKKGDKVLLRLILLGDGIGQRLTECGILAVTGEVVQHVSHIELQDNIHTALEVESKSDLILTNRFERGSEPNLLRSHGVEVGDLLIHIALGVLLSPTLVDRCHYRKGEVVGTDQDQEDGGPPY